MNKSIIKKLAVLLAAGSVIGLIVSTLGLWDDITSTAHTLNTYFPAKFNVTPASSYEGNFRLGVFVSVAQIIAAAIAFSENFAKKYRILAGVILALSIPFDGWTDVVYRSNYLQGNIIVATVTTIAFYTFGTEIINALSWVLLSLTWRQAIADVAWWVASFLNNTLTIGAETKKFWQAAQRKAQAESQKRISERNAEMGFTSQAQYRSSYGQTQTPARSSYQSQPSRQSYQQPVRQAVKPTSKQNQSMFEKLGLSPASSYKSPPPPDDDEYTYEDLV